MEKNSIELKVCKAFFYMLLVTSIMIFIMIIYKYGSNQKNEKNIRNTIETFSEIDFSNNKKTEEAVSLEYQGYKIIGIVKIPKINLEYPILEIGDIDPQSAKAPMKLSIIKYWGENVNDYGNLSIAGHNNKDGTMFGKARSLKEGDIIELTDLKGQIVNYSIYSIFVTDPNDVSVLETKDESVREVTLITCTNGNKQRLILKAKEV